MIKLEHASEMSLVGNKAYGLYGLIKCGFNVPEGFVIPYFAKKEEIEKFVNKNCDSQDLYAVRSSSNLEDSGEYSFAGLFETKLGVNKKDLTKTILEIMSSHSERLAEFCKLSKKDPSQIKISVIVQRMVNSDVSGVCFTLNPVNKNKDEIIIEAGLGLGEFVVQNEITPDFYRVGKGDLEILEKRVFAQHKKLVLESPPKQAPIFVYNQKLPDEKIQELAEAAKRIEACMGFPSDIEWTIENNNLYILQARPICF